MWVSIFLFHPIYFVLNYSVTPRLQTLESLQYCSWHQCQRQTETCECALINSCGLQMQYIRAKIQSSPSVQKCIGKVLLEDNIRLQPSKFVTLNHLLMLQPRLPCCVTFFFIATHMHAIQTIQRGNVTLETTHFWKISNLFDKPILLLP